MTSPPTTPPVNGAPLAPALRPLVEPAGELSVQEIARYSRHVILPDVGMLGQRRLRAARVAVVGAGGLGSPVLLYLAAAGVGTIGVIDDDVVDPSNLQRQVIHGGSDVGRPKVDSAAESVAEVNPHVNVVRHAVHLDASNALDVLAGYDLVLDGTDNFATRYLVADACELLGVPEVWGSIYRFDGQVSVFWPGHGPLYRDLFPQAPPPGAVPSCAEGGVLGVLCAAIGSVMATEAVKLICGIGDPLVGRLLVFDALAMTWRTVRLRPDPDRVPVRDLVDDPFACVVLEPAPSSGEVDPTQLAAMLAERDAGTRRFLLVDVREPHEREVVAIDGSVLVPVGRLVDADGTVRPDILVWLDELAGAADPQDAVPPALVLYCKSGARSARALAALHAAGRTDAVHLNGGVLAWVRQVEPEKPLY
ncbi:MAG: molybdopterin-synthase adenylyltransferase MoeB [Kineosporiaceae bacterium]|nr:molybdopterin-synthase adenylyltransferase MoeB [Kineosporiaceae bacterium]